MKHDIAHDPQMLSALADGQLRGDALAQAVAQATETEEGQATWHAYQVVGDVLRSADLADSTRDAAFLARFRQRMAAEGTPHALEMQPNRPAVVAALDNGLNKGLNTSGESVVAVQAVNRRWKFLAVAASVAAVSAMGWQWMGTGLVSAPAPQLAIVQPARTPTPTPTPTAPDPAAQLAQGASAVTPLTEVAGAPGVMLRDPRLDELLAAHRQFGGTSALQMPAGFLRNATFEGSGR